jgi:hypothetical protein
MVWWYMPLALHLGCISFFLVSFTPRPPYTWYPWNSSLCGLRILFTCFGQEGNSCLCWESKEDCTVLHPVTLSLLWLCSPSSQYKHMRGSYNGRLAEWNCIHFHIVICIRHRNSSQNEGIWSHRAHVICSHHSKGAGVYSQSFVIKFPVFCF